MKRVVVSLVMVLGLVGPVLGGIIFQDNFEGETVGDVPANWTKSTQWGSLSVSNEGGTYGKGMNTGLWSSYSTAYTVDGNQSFSTSQMTSWWSLTFDVKNLQQWADWAYSDIVRTPGNYVLSKDQHRAIDVYDSNGTLLGTTDSGLGSDQIWTHYSVEYHNGTLTVSAANANGTTAGTFTVSAPDYTAQNKISYGLFVGGGGSSSADLDNIVLSTVPEPATLTLLGLAVLGFRRSKR